MTVFDNARIICPETNKDYIGHIIIRDEVIQSCQPGPLPENHRNDAQVHDCSGAIILPGFIDILCESGEPDRPWLEGLDGLVQCALSSGFTHIVHGAGLRAAIDSPSKVRDILSRTKSSFAHVHILGAATLGHHGSELTEMGLMLASGAISISDGYGAIRDALVLRRVMEYLEPFSIPFVLQPTELALEEGGFMHEGLVSTQIGLHGIPEAAELIGITRAISLCRQTGCQIHLSHISTQRSVDLLANAKSEGLPITGGVAAIHLLLTDEAVRERHYDTSTKIRPPLRPEKDRLALIQGLREGVIDCVFSAHHPMSRAEKELEYAEAEFGISGIEHAALGCLSVLNDIALLAKVMSSRPAEIFGFKTAIKEGQEANLVILDRLDRFQEQPCYVSKGTNDPLRNTAIQGHIKGTFSKGHFHQNRL